MRRQSSNRSAGNTLILILAITLGVVLTLLLFALSYVRLLGTSQEQKTAIEAAALAAARDLSKIVVNTDQFGYVSLSDSAPIGTGTLANDNYPLPVHGINSLIGTARLDLIIGDKLGDADMKALANQDMTNILTVWNSSLLPALQASILPGGTAKDVDGNNVTPYQSALTAYQQNDIRMTGDTTYVNNSMQIRLGCVTGGAATNIPIPKPQTGANSSPVAASLQAPGANNWPVYLSYVNIPYDGTDFVFGGIGDSVRLMDVKRWVTTISGLPYQIPTIVKVEADQLIKDTVHSPSGETVRAAACAQPASVHDPKPYPGAMSISFPDGPPPGITTPGVLFTDGQLNDPGNEAEVYTANGGDYPTDGGTLDKDNHPLDSSGTDNTRPIGRVWRVGFYDWVRRGGVKAQIDQVLAVQNTALNPPPITPVWWSPYTNITGPGGVASTKKSMAQVDGGVIHIFRFDNTGAVTYQSKTLAPYPYAVVAEHQFYSDSLDGYQAGSDVTIPITAVVAVANGNGNGGGDDDDDDDDDDDSGGGALQTITEPVKLRKRWDVFIRDEVRVPGKNLGGKHGGEPLNNSNVAHQKPDHLYTNIAMQGSEGNSAALSTGFSSGAKKKPKKPGTIPLIGSQSDFAESMMTVTPAPPFTQFQTGGGSGVRPTYTANGTAVDIRFRRQVDVSKLSKTLGFSVGYLTEELSPTHYP